MRVAKEITLVATFTALLLGGQLVLSGVAGIEIVTVLFLSFCYTFGVRRGLLVAISFSLLRCLLFGFFPTVVVLYLVYYPLFAIFAGLLGNVFRHKMNWRIHVTLIVYAVVMTGCFTLIDDLITPWMMGYTAKAARLYFYASLTAMIPQTVCALATVGLLLRPLCKAYRVVQYGERKKKRPVLADAGQLAPAAAEAVSAETAVSETVTGVASDGSGECADCSQSDSAQPDINPAETQIACCHNTN